MARGRAGSATEWDRRLSARPIGALAPVGFLGAGHQVSVAVKEDQGSRRLPLDRRCLGRDCCFGRKAAASHGKRRFARGRQTM
jgi:hypothetical protein